MLLTIYGSTLALSAFLLFWVQPLIGKMLLPILGGSSAVWITCMLFFQGVLLCGYTYAHLLQKYFSIRTQIGLHITLLALAIFTLPFSFAAHLGLHSTSYPTVSLLRALVIEVSLVILLVSSTAPLLQHWFFHSKHRRSQDPYFLYITSNAGSLLGLLAYPLLLEPIAGSVAQTHIWMYAFIILFFFMIICAAILLARSFSVVDHGNAISSPTSQQRLRWVLLSFAPSSLLLAITNYITSDIAAVPLLWVIPLALYLLTFIIAFSPRQIIKPQTVHGLQEYGLIPLAVLFVFPQLHLGGMQTLITVYVCFFICAQACHSELADLRPTGEYVTTFYLWIAVGGFLGGVFNAIIAPYIFHHLYELPITLIILAVLRPYAYDEKFKQFDWKKDIIISLVIFSILVFSRLFSNEINFDANKYLNYALLGSALLYTLVRVRRPWHVAANLIAIFLVTFSIPSFYHLQPIYQERNFYGQHMVLRGKNDVHILMSGKTMHGAQYLTDKTHEKSLTYYRPIKDIIASLGNKPKNIAVIGLGTGTLACLVDKHDILRFYELDRTVYEIAANSSYFTYITDCVPQGGVVLGDGRLQISKAPDKKYDLIILDAFSSDAVPTHLLTLEAMQMYLRKLKASGLLVVHVSNNYLYLSRVVFGAAKRLKLIPLYLHENKQESSRLLSASQWVVLARNVSDVERLAHYKGWQFIDTQRYNLVWTDDFSNIIQILR